MRAPWCQSLLLLAMGCQSHSVLSLGTRPEDTTDEPEPTSAPDVDASVDELDAAIMPSTPEMDAAIAPTQAPSPEPSVPQLDASTQPDPQPAARLVHRHSFDGSGTVVSDSVGGADGLIHGGAALAGTGALRFDGADDYIELPQGLVSGLDKVTVMIWAAVHTDTCWQRFFDFGNGVIVGETAQADTTLYLTPKGCTEVEGPAAYIQFRDILGDSGFVREYLSARSSQLIALDVEHQFVLVLDGPAVLLYLYIDGVEEARRSLLAPDGGIPFTLRDLVDANCWLGRSQYAVDPFLNATMSEFRIYEGALSPDAVLAAFQAGPDALL